MHANTLRQFTKATLIIAVAMLLIGQLIEELVVFKNHDLTRRVEEAFIQTENHLEQKGIDGVAQNFKSLPSEMGENIVVTDDAGKILYQLNKAYLSDAGYFKILVNYTKSSSIVNDLAFIADSKDNLKYTVQMGQIHNPSLIKAMSEKNPIAKKIFAGQASALGNLSNRMITNKDGSTYGINAETNLLVDYSYIASKNMHLYFIYDLEVLSNNAFASADHLLRLETICEILGIFSFILYWLGLAEWLFLDAKSRGLNSYLWLCIGLFSNFIGFIIYKIKYKTPLVCPHCGRLIHSEKHDTKPSL